MNPCASALLTDHYQLTMLQAYHREGLADTASFELFVRKLPPERNFLVAAGLEQVLDFLEGFQFTAEECAYLAGVADFTPEFIDYLAGLRFTGTVEALPEGTVFFQNEPIVRVTAPLPEAQVIETRLINLIQLQTLIASKAARSVLVAPDRWLVDFGLRRAHGAEAGLLAARAAYLAGYGGSSNVLAGKLFGIPCFGTMAHSYIMAHDDEADAFRRFAEALPSNVVLLLDTYDTLAAARKVVDLAPSLAAVGIPIRSVRLDSGDLGALAKAVRAILDQGGLSGCRIFASGDLDEHAIAALLAAGAPIDGFGVGTRLTTSADAPSLNCAYKLQEYAGKPRRKRSEAKATWPGCKQVYRHYDADGRFSHDLIAGAWESASGEPLLRPVMRHGRRLEPPEPLESLRRRARDQLARLPAPLRAIDRPAPYPVTVSDGLKDLAARLDAQG
ncbi:nicotinate phosphoribosyltransferase [Candidatus Methylocalor cossyra]|uniref:Nicotinate phosphoribosyltransferase n=1 Tax=Candidatus Methylocalor cossyra TaxID=3108543 RepID=A0ABM9NGT4_9GAMM